MHSVYTEVPVQENTVRLLRLDSSQGDFDATVQCSLHAVSLDDPPEFEALSYCWADHPEPQTIVVNGHHFQVTSNLDCALRHLRRTERPRMLWVDALCINQDDMAERGSQVALMHEIYQKANKTLSWVGGDGGSGELALEFLTWYAGRKTMMHPSDVDGHHKQYEAEGWSAVADLMERPYWRRLWVMQEIALSRNQPRVVCGRQSILWNMLLQALGNGESAYYVMRLNRVRGATARYAKQDSVKGPKKQGRHIIFLLSHSSGFKATVPVDRVYALYGLLRVAGIVDFQPDYTKSVAEVYRDTTAYVLRLKGGLDVLELRSHHQKADLPSWVVDLSKQPPLSFPVPNKCLWERLGNSDAMQSSTLNIDAELASLTATGTVVDRVATVDPTPTCLARAFRRATEASNTQSLGGDSLRLGNSSALEYWTRTEGPDHAGSLCRNVLDYLSRHQDAVACFCANKADSPLSWLPRQWDWKQMLMEAPICDLNEYRSENETDQAFDERYWTALTPLLCKLGLMLHGRTCFQTQNNFSGIGLVGTQPGDKLVALQSTKQLHVLRLMNDFHQYVGAAMLVPPTDEQGALSLATLSALFAKVRNRGIEDEDFVIR